MMLRQVVLSVHGLGEECSKSTVHGETLHEMLEGQGQQTALDDGRGLDDMSDHLKAWVVRDRDSLGTSGPLLIALGSPSSKLAPSPQLP